MPRFPDTPFTRTLRAHRRVVGGALLVVLTVASVGLFLLLTRETRAAIGDIAIYREVTGTDDAIPTTATNITWDTTVREAGLYAIDVGRTNVTLSEQGHYLMMYNLGVETSGGSARSEIQGFVNLAGTNLAYGRGSCYIRRASGQNECFLTGAAIVESTSTSQQIRIIGQRTDTNTATVRRMAGKSGLMLMRLDDAWDFLRVREAGGGQAFNSATFATVDWDTDDELDTGTFSRSGGDITLARAGHYLVTANVMFRNSGTGQRNQAIRITLDGYELPGTRTTAYSGGTSSTLDHSAVWMGIIVATTTNQVLRLQGACSGETCSQMTNVGGQTALTIARLPETAEYVRLTELGGGQVVDATDDPILWDTQSEVDGAFSHSTTSNTSRVTVSTDDDYLFFGSFFSDRTGTAATTEQYPHWEWNTSPGGKATYGSFGSYNRGDSGTTGAFTSGSAGGIILAASSSAYVEILNTDESTVNDALNVFIAERTSLMGVRVSTLNMADVYVQVQGTQEATSSVPASNKYLGGAFTIEATRGSETVTDITITETGTVDADADLANVRLYYETDTTLPYDCASESYNGTETQFGATSTGGFSGANGTSTFSGSVAISKTATMCVYVVVDVEASAVDGQTIEVEIADPSSDVVIVSGNSSPNIPQAITGATTLLDDNLTQVHYHFRNNDGGEATSTSATAGVEDSPLVGLVKNAPIRLRFEVSNEGSFESPPTTFRFEYATKTASCAAVSDWRDVGSAGGGFGLYDSVYFEHGSSTTNIATTTGGVSDENDVFLSPNGGMLDTSSESSALTLASTTFAELEYSFRANNGTESGTTYCFRLSDQGTPLTTYARYPEATIKADVRVSATSTQVASVDASSTDFYLGGTFVITEQSSSRDVTSITVTETGTVDAQQNLDNIRLRYDLDTTAPYDCASESYDAGDTPYGFTDTDGFSGPNGSSTFSGAVTASTTATMCVYVVLDVKLTALNGVTVDVEISDPSSEVGVTSGTVNPNTAVALPGSTIVVSSELSQLHYHFRFDDGSETLASSMTGGVEDTPITVNRRGDAHRLRMLVSNEGGTSSPATSFRLEYGTKVSTCSAVASWTALDIDDGAWAPSPTTNLTEGADTTNIATTTGGVTNENISFLSPNGGVRDESGETGSLILTETEYVEMEFSIEATENASAGTTYCFRLTNAGATLSGDYVSYPEATVANTNDFFIQRGVSTINTSASSVTIIAGTNYTKPRRSGTAFIRITNSQHTGAGHSAGGASQNADAVTAYVSNPGNLATSITFTRTSASASLNTRINWEIIEYIGPVGGDNEIVVRDASSVTFGGASATANANVAGVVTDADMVVFITGIMNPSANVTTYHQSTIEANWNGTTDQAVFTRRATGNAPTVSYAAVEFTGANWKIQRIAHTFTVAGSEQQVAIPQPLNSTSRAFVIAQFSSTANGLDELGTEVWLSSVSTVSFQLESTASPANGHTSVAWIIENTQTNGTPMKVKQSAGTHVGTVEASIEARDIGTTLADVTASSIFLNNRTSGTGTQYPRNNIAYRLTASTTQYELYVSEISASTRTYRTEVVEWPTAVRTVTQNYYRFYADNDALDPDDAWPQGGSDLGEITSITGVNGPPEPGDVLRIRMSLRIAGNSMSARTRAFKLQYGERETTCGAIGTWLDVGDTSSTTALWRGWNGSPTDGIELSTDPPVPPEDLNLSQSDRAGTYEEDGPTALNPYKVFIGEDVEYDWAVLNQSAPDLTTYCFRMVDSTGAPLDDYLYHPTLTTAGYVVEVSAWRFFGDADSLTPTSPLAATNTAPTSVDVLDPLKLRVVLSEIAGKSGANVKYKLQYSEFPDFSIAYDVVAHDQCTSGSRFCYANGAGSEGATLANRTISTADSCVAGVGSGCGTVNEYPFVPNEIGEVGTTTANSAGTVVTLARTYLNPVIIVESISGDDGGGATNRPAAAVITATTSSSFTVRVQEPEGEADTHGVETLAYLVMEAGQHTLPDGTRVDAGVRSTSAYYGSAVAGVSEDTCTFTQTFSSVPVVLSALQTNNNTGSPDFLTAYQRAITTTNFPCAIEVSDGENNAPTSPEVIGWIALSRGTFTNNDTLFEVATTSVAVTGWVDTPWYAYAFPTLYYASAPGIVASKQTRNGADGGWVRYDSTDASSTRLAIDERDGGNRAHTAESVGLLSFSRGTTLIAATSSSFTFDAVTNKEFEFTFENHDAGVNRAYYFRLYDVARSLAIATTSQPSLVTAGGSLTFTIGGLPAGTSTEGVVTDATTTATSITFGTLPWNTDTEAAHRLSVSTNAARGYQVFLFERQGLIAGTREIAKVTGTNEAPLVWTTGCDPGAESCYGYHTGDDTLAGGSTRFLSDSAYAAPSTTLSEIAYSSVPVPQGETTDIVYRIKVTPNQPAGGYESRIVYIIVPVF